MSVSPQTRPDRPQVSRTQDLADRYRDVRSRTERLAAALAPEDQVVQSMPDTSPTKWHRAHVTWFFETFVLKPNLVSYVELEPAYAYLFNSYYEAAGPRHTRAARGMISRPSVAEVAEYRAHVDEAMIQLLNAEVDDATAELVVLGLNHEQQHQELLLMDIKHLFSLNPMLPVYDAQACSEPLPARDVAWRGFDGGIVSVGHDGGGFSFDNELPRHDVLLQSYELADRLVTCGEWLDFIEDGGYSTASLWLSDGWHTVNQRGWNSPEYWHQSADGWDVFTLHGLHAVNRSEPVCHLSYYEADAFAAWAGARLPTEAEWEHAAVASAEPTDDAATRGARRFHPTQDQPAAATGSLRQMFGEVWQWTSSPYVPYPGFRAAPGAVGEYNGKFMVNTWVLRGGCCATPPGHARHTYRNFFHPGTRWHFSGLRLARDAQTP